jgi:hypothetical protein
MHWSSIVSRVAAALIVGSMVTALLGSQCALADDDASACATAANAAEQSQGLPPGLLLAIGRVESGRKLPGATLPVPWPWSINANGQAFMLHDAAQAIAQVKGLQARGIRSVDIGCFQVNLLHHPNAFANLDEAFAPRINAAYAASFLAGLRARAGDWMTAVGWYHSEGPERADSYRHAVWTAWRDAPYQNLPRPVASSVMRVFTPGMMPTPVSASASSWLPVVFRPTALVHSAGLGW